MSHPAIVDGVITVAALVLRDEGGRLLTVRKRGTARFMLPGGKLEPGETPAETAAREAREEVGVDVPVESLQLLGEFVAAAANEPGHQVVSTVYVAPALRAGASWPVAAAGEIEELRWLPLDGPLPEDLAPLLRDAVIPALRA